MKNGSNNWGVSYSRITWCERAVFTHSNIADFNRHDDIILEIVRKSGPPLTLACLDEYSFGLAAAQRILTEFPNVNFIYIGGNWNGYTLEAKEFCLSRQIGLYNSSELSGALWKNEFWNYHKCDKKGNPDYQLSRE